jgi:hypothetical protein
MTTDTTETTTTDPKAQELWDAVVQAVYSDKPEEGVDCEWEECSHPWEQCNQDCVCEGDPLISSFHYLRDDNEDEISESISAAYSYSKDLPFAVLPVLDEDADAMDIRGYFNAVQDTEDAEVELDDEDMGDVVEWMGQWLAYSQESRD